MIEIGDKQKYYEFLRFCVVGLVCTGVDVLLFYSVLRFAPYQIALISGYCISLVLNYLLTVYWTFRVHSSVKNAVSIIAAHLFNLFVVRMGLMYFFTTYCKFDESIAFIPTLLISVLTNFIIIKLIIVKLT